MFQLIRFDKRGTGLSDRPTAMTTLEQRADDIRAVMDAAGVDSAIILGASEGASMAAMFAVFGPGAPDHGNRTGEGDRGDPSLHHRRPSG